jgi:hypothetical protein
MVKCIAEQGEELIKVLHALEKKKDITGEPLTKAEKALGYIIGSTNNPLQIQNVYDALKKVGYIK